MVYTYEMGESYADKAREQRFRDQRWEQKRDPRGNPGAPPLPEDPELKARAARLDAALEATKKARRICSRCGSEAYVRDGIVRRQGVWCAAAGHTVTDFVTPETLPK